MFYWVLTHARIGKHRGGMFVEARGIKEGKPVERSWHLIAEGDDGPYIPSMTIEAILRKQLDSKQPASGARPATNALELTDYEALFENRRIFTGQRSSEYKNNPVHEQILEARFSDLPPQMQAIHRIGPGHSWHGRSQIIRSKNILGRIIAAMMRFPPQADDVAVTVKMEPHKGGERWTRTFGNKTFSSFQTPGTGRNEGLLVERFGLVSVAMSLEIKGSAMYLVPQRWNILGLPLPKLLIPGGDSFEYEKDGTFHFDVTIKAPMFGLIVSYKGWLTPTLGRA